MLWGFNDKGLILWLWLYFTKAGAPRKVSGCSLFAKEKLPDAHVDHGNAKVCASEREKERERERERKKLGLCIIIEQLNRIFGRWGSALNRICCCNMFYCCCVPDCSCTANRERHLSFFALTLKSKRLLNHWVHVIRQAYLLLNRQAWVGCQHFVNAEGGRLYPDKVSLLFLPRPFICSSNKRRKPPRYRSASLGNEPVTIIVVANYGTLVEWVPVHLHFWSLLSQPATFPCTLRA